MKTSTIAIAALAAAITIPANAMEPDKIGHAKLGAI